MDPEEKPNFFYRTLGWLFGGKKEAKKEDNDENNLFAQLTPEDINLGNQDVRDRDVKFERPADRAERDRDYLDENELIMRNRQDEVAKAKSIVDSSENLAKRRQNAAPFTGEYGFNETREDINREQERILSNDPRTGLERARELQKAREIVQRAEGRGKRDDEYSKMSTNQLLDQIDMAYGDMIHNRHQSKNKNFEAKYGLNSQRKDKKERLAQKELDNEAFTRLHQKKLNLENEYRNRVGVDKNAVDELLSPKNIRERLIKNRESALRNLDDSVYKQRLKEIDINAFNDQGEIVPTKSTPWGRNKLHQMRLAAQKEALAKVEKLKKEHGQRDIEAEKLAYANLGPADKEKMVRTRYYNDFGDRTAAPQKRAIDRFFSRMKRDVALAKDNNETARFKDFVVKGARNLGLYRNAAQRLKDFKNKEDKYYSGNNSAFTNFILGNSAKKFNKQLDEFKFKDKGSKSQKELENAYADLYPRDDKEKNASNARKLKKGAGTVAKLGAGALLGYLGYKAKKKFDFLKL